jgi:polyhydroxybutyrate depolymerase
LTQAARLTHLVLVASACLGSACSQADLYAITGPPGAGHGGSGGDAGSGGNGGKADSAGKAGGGSGGGGSPGGMGGKNGGMGGGGSGAGGRGGSGGSEPLACSQVATAPGDTNRTIVVDGTTRSYVLHVPTAYTGLTPVPLVVDFHGIGQTGAKERTSSPYPAALDPEGVVMAFPDGLRGPAGTAWNVGPCCVANVDDVAFARALVAEVRGLACIEASRIYAVGILTGGGLAHYLGCHAADVFAAVAPAAFDLLAENSDDCTPPRPISVISFRGTADSRVPYEGGPSSLVPGMPLTFLGAQGTFQRWAAIDGCQGSASMRDTNGCSAYSGCNGGAEVILCTKDGGGEDPGDPSIAWPVLGRHTL